MKIYSLAGILVTLFVFSFFLFSCQKDDSSDTIISNHGGMQSHNMGQNCMVCHVKGGDGKGWFTVAGTVYDGTKINTYADATILLYAGPNGTGGLKYTIEADKFGNFFTTKSIDWGSGLYPAAEGGAETFYMPTTVAFGQCSSCHGISVDRIWTK